VIPVHDTPSGATFAVKVHPRAKRNAVTGELGNALKLSLTAPPIEGRANQACLEFVAELLSVPKSSVSIAAGQGSRQKLVRIAGLTSAEVRARLKASLPR
jgi:uncharacterized protein (TIGR00251 family)